MMSLIERSMFHQSTLKQHILTRCGKLRRSWKCSRVNQEAMDNLGFWLMRRINQVIREHSSKVATFSYPWPKPWGTVEPMLLNKKEVRRYIILRIKQFRPDWRCSRIGPVMEAINRQALHHIDGLVHSHPTVGRTFLMS